MTQHPNHKLKNLIPKPQSILDSKSWTHALLPHPSP